MSAASPKEADLLAFDIVTTVPSKTTTRDDARDRLRAIVGQHAQRPASATGACCGQPIRRPTSGASMPADTARRSGSTAARCCSSTTHGRPGARHSRRLRRYAKPEPTPWRWWSSAAPSTLDYSDHRQRLEKLPRGFDWDTCAVHRA
jgi:hypothetical protein